jgi:hypothetical protein
MERLSGGRAAARVVNMGGATFALLAPCSRRPPGHLRCASSATPVASVGLTHFSAALPARSAARGEKRRFCGSCFARFAGWCPGVVLSLPRGYLGQAGGRPSKGFRAAARVV